MPTFVHLNALPAGATIDFPQAPRHQMSFSKHSRLPSKQTWGIANSQSLCSRVVAPLARVCTVLLSSTVVCASHLRRSYTWLNERSASLPIWVLIPGVHLRLAHNGTVALWPWFGTPDWALRRFWKSTWASHRKWENISWMINLWFHLLIDPPLSFRWRFPLAVNEFRVWVVL